MTKDSTTGERELTVEERESLAFIRDGIARFIGRTGSIKLDTASEVPLIVKGIDALLSRPSRMAASSEGEAVAKALVARLTRHATEYRQHLGAELWADLVAARDMLAASPDAGREVEPVAWRWRVAISAGRSGWRYSSCKLHGAEPLYASIPPVAVPVSEEMVEAAARAIAVKYAGPLPADSEHAHQFEWLAPLGQSCCRSMARDALAAALAVPDKGVQGDQGSSGGLGQPGSGSQPGAAVGATAALACFAEEVAAIIWDGSSLDPEDFETIGLKHGVIECVAFDPEKHDNHLGVDVFPGDDWYVLSASVTDAARATASTTSASGIEQVAADEVQPIREALNPSAQGADQ